MSFFENTRKPEGLGGKLMVLMMNVGHRGLANWGMQFLRPIPDAAILDCGCGGGANLAGLLKRYPDSRACGVDYSEISVQKSRVRNRKAIQAGRCRVLSASVAALPFEGEQFDLTTAFETVYFWPGLARCFGEVYRVLKPGGTFLICNECSGENDGDDKWTRIVGGMTVYRDAELKRALEQAGFHEIEIHKNGKGWLCVKGRK